MIVTALVAYAVATLFGAGILIGIANFSYSTRPSEQSKASIVRMEAKPDSQNQLDFSLPSPRSFSDLPANER